LQELDDILNPAVPQTKKKKEFESHSDPPFEHINEPDPLPSTSGTCEVNVFSLYRNRSTQTLKRRGTRSVRTQTVMARSSSPTKPVLEGHAVGKVTDVVTESKPIGEPTDVDDLAVQTAPTTEVDVESIASSVSKESLASNISVDEISSADSDESIEENAEDPEYDKRTILVEGKPPQEQIKFIVFEQAILDVFGQCVRCGSKCVITVENQIGSCCKICIACSSDSEHYFEWTTGPCVFKMAAFHLLLASGVLATGMEALKVLRLFEGLKFLNVKQRELSSILKCYTIPAVYNVWNAEQSARLEEAAKGSPL